MTHSHRRLRVLLLAEACNPRFSSVPLLAYYRYAALCRYADVTLVTQIRNRPGFLSGHRGADNVVCIDSEQVASPLHKLGKILTLNHPSALGTRSAICWAAYLYFEHLVWQQFRSALLGGRFDLVHRLTPVSPTFPSPIALKFRVPFVLGPLNGALPWPKGSRSIRRQEGEYLTGLRSLYRILPFVRQTYERADLILTATRYVEEELAAPVRRRCVRFPENGVNTAVFHAGGRTPPGDIDPFTILFVGRLIPLKNPALIVESLLAAGLHEHRRIRLVFVGTGPEEAKVRTLVDSSGLAEYTTFAGWVPHDELPEHYRGVSLLALPSIHESGGAVLIEAMACGLPCVVINYGGPGEYVTDDTGIRVQLASPVAMARGFSIVFQRLHEDRKHLNELSESCARVAINRWSWDAQARRLGSLYKRVLECHRRKSSPVQQEEDV